MSRYSIAATLTSAAIIALAGCATENPSRPIGKATPSEPSPANTNTSDWTTVKTGDAATASPAQTSTSDASEWGERVVRKDEAGKTEAEGYMLDGKPNGPWVFYWPDGLKKGAGSYASGERTGIWTFWNQDGSKATSGTFLHGANDGTWQHWYPTGVRKAEQHFRAGLMHGTTRTWDEFGRIQQEITYDADLPVNTDGKQVPHGPYKQYASNGTVIAEGPYDNGVREGVWVYRFPTGQIERAGRYYHGEDLGLWLVGVEGTNKYKVQKKLSLQKGVVIDPDFEMMTQVFGPNREDWPVPLSDQDPAMTLKGLKPGEDLILKPKDGEAPAPTPDKPINPEPK